MKLIFATANRHKIDEVSAVLGPGFELDTPASAGITEEIPETAPTLEGNALQKARYIYERTGADCFADDTGLEVGALGGEPGVWSARYASLAGEGAPHDSAANVARLLCRLSGVEDRRARFRTVIALILGGREFLFEGTVEGFIIDTPRGTGGFGYDPVFVPEGFDRTFAEMTAAEKNVLSHRGRATGALAEFLRGRS